MTFFIVVNSFSAPFCSDQSFQFFESSTAEEALEKFSVQYKHPCGLYAAMAYSSADSYHRGEKPLAKWLSNKALFECQDKKRGRVVTIK